MKRTAVALVVLAAAALGLRWLVSSKPPAERPRPSLLLVTIDTLRADRVGAYGGPPGLTPNIDALAGQGVVFEEALASVPLTLPSHATILSGLEPVLHGVHDNGTFVFPPDRATLATMLKTRGYVTGAFVGAYVLDRRFGLARGFDVYDDAIERREGAGNVLESERRCDAVAAAAAEWVGKQAAPFFAWAHFYDPHAPYDPPPEAAGRFPGRPYEGEVAHADVCFGRLRDAAQSKAGDGLIVAVLSDHGESMGEHGERTHGFFLYQPTLRIPIVVAGAGVPAGARLAGRARTADVAPTLLRLLGAPVPEGLDGTDLLVGPRPRESYAETLYPQTLGWAPLHSLRTGSLKYIEAPRPELYDLARDPGETTDLASSRKDDVARLAAALAALRARERPVTRAAAAPEVAERLRALGYVDAGPAPAAGGRALADPKDRVALWQRFQDATVAEGRGDRAGALRELRGLVSEDPGNPTFRRSLAAALRRSGAPRDAEKVLADIETTAPGDPLAWHERAVAAEASGRLGDALRAAQAAIAIDAELPELHNHLGVLRSRTGSPAEALASFDRAIALDPNNARAWTNRGNALHALGRAGEAAEAFGKAIALAPRDPDPRNGLGVLAVEAGDLDRAAALFREVLAAHPALHESRLNLAVVYVRQNRVGDARAELRAVLAGRPDRETAARAAAFLRDIS